MNSMKGKFKFNYYDFGSYIFLEMQENAERHWGIFEFSKESEFKPDRDQVQQLPFHSKPSMSVM